MDCNGTAFLYLWQKFPLLSDAKTREGVFTGPDIRSLLHDEVSERIITSDEQRARHVLRGGYRLPRKWTSIVISETGVQYVHENPLSEFSSVFFPENCGSVSDEQSEHFHQDIAAMEGRYKGKCSPSICADYCRTLMCDSPNSTFNRQAKKALLHYSYTQPSTYNTVQVKRW